MRKEFEFYPCAVRAQNLKKDLYKNLYAGLRYMLSFAAEKFAIDVTEANAAIDKAEKAQYVTGYVFALNKNLIAALEQGDQPRIEEIVRELAAAHYVLDAFAIYKGGLNDPEKTWTVDILSEGYADRTFDVCGEKDFLQTKEALEKGVAFLRQLSPGLWEEMTTFSNSFVIFDSPKIRSGTTFNYFGSIYYDILRSGRNWITTLEDIVHEAAHLYLYVLTGKDALILNELEYVYDAPFRSDKRPLAGIYHAIFVAGRLLYFYKDLMLNFPAKDNELKEGVKKRIAFLQTEFSKGMEIIKKDGKLTPLAEELILNTEKSVQSNFSEK